MTKSKLKWFTIMCKVKLLVGSACGSTSFWCRLGSGPYPDLNRHKKMESRIRRDRYQNDNDLQHWLYIYIYLLPTFCRWWAGSRGASNAGHWPWRPGLMSSPSSTDHVLPQYLWFWFGSFSHTIMFCKFCCCCISSRQFPHVWCTYNTQF